MAKSLVKTHLCKSIEEGKQIVEQLDQLLGRTLRGERRKSLNVGEENAAKSIVIC